MTTAQVVETSVPVDNNSPIQDLVHPDDILNLLMKWLQGSNLSQLVYLLWKKNWATIFKFNFCVIEKLS